MQRSIASFQICSLAPRFAAIPQISNRDSTRTSSPRRAAPRLSSKVKALVQILSRLEALFRCWTACWISFWTQLALSLTSAGIFFFTLFATRARPTSSLFLLVGVASSLISTGLVRKILDDARRVINADDLRLSFEKWNGSGWLLRNTDVNLVGMASSIIALQGECGTLVAKLLRTSSSSSVYVAPSQAGPASIDVFAVQGCANVLLSHFVSLFFLTFALRLLQRLHVKASAAA